MGAVFHVILLLLFGYFEVPNVAGAVYKVGDASGWTTLGNINYTAWALPKNFQIGDVIVFEFNPQFHNVMRVTHAEYRACNVSNPISTYTTGNDTIVIQTRGHHLYLCGVPGHCQAGQKVDINVVGGGGAVAPPPMVVPKPVSSGAVRPCAEFMLFGWVVLLMCGVLFCDVINLVFL